MNRRSLIVAALMFLGNILVCKVCTAETLSWLVYYSDKAPPEAFNEYGLLVLDSDFNPPLRPLADRGKTLLGYLSLGEVESHRAYFADVKAEGLLLRANENWKGSYFVDVRDRRWTSRVVQELIPNILRRGFDGLFLDTLDNAPHLERLDPRKYRGMTAAAARLVCTIRRHYPTLKIMMNRSYELLPQVEQHIDILLGESVFSDYDFKTKTYRLVPRDLYQEQVKLLQAAKKRRPELKVFSLDYWDPADAAGIASIYREQRHNGFEPYVATVELDRIIKEPKQ